MSSSTGDEESNEEILARIKQVDEACCRIEKSLENFEPAMRFNIILNCMGKQIACSHNVPLILGMAVLGISQAIMMQGNAEIVDLGETEKDDRAKQPTH